MRRLAEEAVADKQDLIAAVYDMVKLTFPYLPDPYGVELFVHPNRVAEDFFAGRVRGLDCDDMALLNASLLGSIGYEVEIQLLGNPDLSHAVCVVYSPILQDWLIVDTASNVPLGWDMQAMYSRKIDVRPMQRESI